MPPRLPTFAVTLLVWTVAFVTPDCAAREIAIASPNGRVRLALDVSDDGRVTYTVDRDGRQIIEASPLAIQLAQFGAIGENAAVVNVSERTIDETAELIWGKTSRLRNHCRAATVRLKSGNGLEWDVELRAYDDGIAIRYGFPQQDALDRVAIENEATEFRLAGHPSVLCMPLKNFTTSHEAVYERKLLAELPTNQLFEMPLLAVWNNGPAAAITEARLRDFAGMYLVRPDGGSANMLQARLAPLPTNADAVVESATPCWSSWRVVLLADRAGQLVESNLLLCLNDAPAGDYSWLKPGKTSWPWWNGTIEHGPPSTPEVNFAFHKKYIDFCAANRIAYHSVISVAESRPWYVQSGPPGFDPRPDTDVLTPRPDLDLPRILAYAKEKGVGIRLWVWWKPLSEKLDEAFAAYERWGVKGLMIDFMDRDDQEMVEWQERALRAAAKHKLHIQFHGSYKPTGEQRTFPNLFNREGVLNLEYLKWTEACAPPHNVNVAYTRALAGPTDFHLGGFRAAARGEFQARDEMPMVLGTRCHQLALYVVFENPMPMVADTPESYADQPGFEFICEVPTTWDETRFVAGEAGEFVVVARRSGKNWYVGGITNWTQRELKLPLHFLGAGTFEANLFVDKSHDGRQPNELRTETRNLNASTSLDVSLAPGGGIAAVLRPR